MRDDATQFANHRLTLIFSTASIVAKYGGKLEKRETYCYFNF